MLEQRASRPELMDLPDFSRQQAIDSYRYIEPVNRWLGGQSAIISFFMRASATWEPDTTVRVLDAGCGSADIPLALAAWGRRRGLRLLIDAVDRHPHAAELARRRCADYDEITVRCCDALRPDGRQYDYVLASMFLHHFPSDQLADVLGRLLARCGRTLVINDLLRDPLAYAGTWLVSLAAPAVFRHDARLSVQRGFRPAELKSILAAAPALSRYRIQRRFFYRFLLTINKDGTV